MGILLAAMAAAGDAGSQALKQSTDQQNKLDLETQRSTLEEQKSKAIMQAQQDFANAPNKRAQDLMAAAGATPIHVTADPVTTLSGNYINPNAPDPDGSGSGTKSRGLPGDYATLKTRISAIPDDDTRTQGLAQLEQQRAYDQSAADTAAQANGVTRPPTSHETMASAYGTAVAHGDLQAAAIIKAAMPDNLMILPDGGTLVDKTTGKAVMMNTGKQDRQDQREDRKDARQSDAEDARAARQTQAITAANNDSPFTRELKALYPNGGPDYDEALRQRINKETGINAAGGGGRSVVYNGRIIASGNEVAAALKNITELPVTANAGLLGFGKPPSSGIYSAGVAALKNQLNDDQIKDYNTMWTGVSRNLGTLETSGLATTGSLISSIDKLQFVPGDNGYNALRKLAEVRQITEAALEPKLADPAVPPDQKKYIEGVIDKVKAAVPYTHADLTNFKREQDASPNLTFTDFAKNTLGVKVSQASPANNAPRPPKAVDTTPDPYAAPPKSAPKNGIPSDIADLLTKYGK